MLEPKPLMGMEPCQMVGQRARNVLFLFNLENEVN